MYTFFKTKQWAAWAYLGGIGIILLLVAQTYCAVLLNEWYKNFYDILQSVELHTITEFWLSLATFMYIVMPYIVLISVTNFLSRMYTLRWRQAMADDMTNKWMNTDTNIEGASQRIQQDSERFAKIVGSLGTEIVKGIMVLIAFIPILWSLSNELDIPVIGCQPGSLVYIAICLSFFGIIVSWFVGYKLPKLEYNNQVTEAAYRKPLVHAEDNRSLTSKGFLYLRFKELRKNHETLFLHLSYFDLWASLYGQSIVIVPFLIGGIGLFKGILTLGMLVQISNCFSKVHESFSIVLNRWTAITELRSIYLRLTEFYKLMEEE
jgi:peptide/bleomycin uptake transporter